MTLHAADLDQFIARLRERLDAGARQYGDTSFQRPLVSIIGEVEQELLDVAGWGLIAWVRLQRLRDRVARIEKGGTDGES